MVELSKVTLRRVLAEDQPLLFRLFASGRPDLEWLSGIGREQKDEFIFQQHIIQQQELFRSFPDAEYNIILLEGQPVGRLYLYKGKSEFRILDIILLPDYRQLGIGKKLLEDILEEAAHCGRSVRLQVAWYNNAAARLYERLGFRIIEDMGVCREMCWSPEGE